MAERDGEEGEGGEERVSPLELFFDVVFVFSITQVTAFIAADPTWHGMGRGMLVLALVWWAWVSYSWLTNTRDTNENSTRVVMFAAMGGMFVVAMSISGAFGDEGLLFAGAYFVVRAAHILATHAAAFVALGANAALCCALILYEVVRFRAPRAQVRREAPAWPGSPTCSGSARPHGEARVAGGCELRQGAKDPDSIVAMAPGERRVAEGVAVGRFECSRDLGDGWCDHGCWVGVG